MRREASSIVFSLLRFATHFATNSSGIPVFPPFSVTQTLIGYNNIRFRCRKALHGLSGQMFWEVFVLCLKVGKKLEITLETEHMF